MWTALRARWLGSRWFGRRWYQRIDLGGGALATARRDVRAQRRTESFLRWLPRVVQPEDRVVDIGCNAGLFSFAAGEICQSVVGVELDKHFIAHARLVQETWRKEHGASHKVEIVEGDIVANLHVFWNCSLVLASKVLYHKWLGEGLRPLMKAIADSPADRILAQGHTTQGELGTAAGMIRLFAEHGFRGELVEDVPEYPIVLARRAA
jgi:SAM-dependent methyltransferase